MKKFKRASQKNYMQLERSLRISILVKKQIFIILALLASSVLAFLLGNYLKLDANIQNFFLGLSGNLLVAVVIFLFLEQGIKSLHPISEIRHLPVMDFIENVSRAKTETQIRILETFTFLINEHPREFTTAIKQALKNGAKVEILLFHPFSEGAIKRAQQLKGQVDVQGELQKNLARLYDLQSTLAEHDKKNFTVKIYTALPSIAMYRCGDWAYVSLFPIEKRADRAPNLHVPIDTPLGSYVDDAFDELWAGTPETPTILLTSHMRLHIGATFSGTYTSHSGHYFAYEEISGKIDSSKCFAVEESHAFFSIYDPGKEKDKVIFQVDEIRWQAVPHLVNPKDPKELEEYNHACQLIEQRYELATGRLNGHVNILRFQDIEKAGSETSRQKKLL